MYLEDLIRRRSLTFLIHLTDILELQPITKYCALLFYEDRFLSLLECLNEEEGRIILRVGNLNLYPTTLAGLQLLGIASIWISAKIHETDYPSSTSLKMIAHNCITEKRFKKKDIAKAERMLLQAINYDITSGPTVYSVFQDLLVIFREATGIGEFITFDACETILDLLYNLPSDCIDVLKFPKPILSAAVLAVGYLLCVPVKMSDFPFLQWLMEAANVEWPHVELVMKVILCDFMGCPLEEISTRRMIKCLEYEFMGYPLEEFSRKSIIKSLESEDDNLWIAMYGMDFR